MNTILVKLDKSNNKIIAELIKKLGGSVVEVKNVDLEDLLLGDMMEEEKTGKSVSRSTIMKKLRK
jgi:hypothetical protein